MGEAIRHWAARRKSALVLKIIQGEATVAAASRQFDLAPAEIESCAEDGKRSMENALLAKPEDVREQYERQLKAIGHYRSCSPRNANCVFSELDLEGFHELFASCR